MMVDEQLSGDATVFRSFPVYIREPKIPIRAKGEAERADRLLPELSVVTLTHPVEHGAREVPRGTKGTIVFAYEDGQHYEVEFFEPFPCVVTVARADIQPR
jgi:hypothetical protein